MDREFDLTIQDQDKDQDISLDQPSTEISLEEEVETLQPPAADDNEVSQIHGAMSGIASGIIKVPEGILPEGSTSMHGVWIIVVLSSTYFTY